MGAWIEIGSGKAGGARGNTVAPLVGAWIEIYFSVGQMILKSVAPLVGAWIEILQLMRNQSYWRRSSRGSVD